MIRRSRGGACSGRAFRCDLRNRNRGPRSARQRNLFTHKCCRPGHNALPPVTPFFHATLPWLIIDGIPSCAFWFSSTFRWSIRAFFADSGEKTVTNGAPSNWMPAKLFQTWTISICWSRWAGQWMFGRRIATLGLGPRRRQFDIGSRISVGLFSAFALDINCLRLRSAAWSG
jgi:hypothetical protein